MRSNLSSNKESVFLLIQAKVQSTDSIHMTMQTFKSSEFYKATQFISDVN